MGRMFLNFMEGFQARCPLLLFGGHYGAVLQPQVWFFLSTRIKGGAASSQNRAAAETRNKREPL